MLRAALVDPAWLLGAWFAPKRSVEELARFRPIMLKVCGY